MQATPFSGLKVLDFSRYLPGGYATQVIADMGAEVIKVEDTGLGDFCRHDYPTRAGGISYYITALGRNKKSVSLNLKDAEVVDLFLKMAADADVIIESFRPGVTKKLGIDYDTVSRINPKIIYCSISGYGQNDPRSLKAQHDLNMQAQSGYLSLNGGTTSPLHLCDLASGMVAGQSILAALFARERSNEGAYIDISMFDAFVWWNSLLDARFDFNGGVCKREDLEYPAPCYNVYETKDGEKLAFGMVEMKFWKEFCEQIGAPDLIDAHLHRRWEVPEAFKKMESIVASKTYAEWADWFSDKDLCVAKVNSKTEAIEEITASNPDTLRYVDFPSVGRVLQTALPHHISSLPLSLDSIVEPSALGADTYDELKKLGCDNECLTRLREKGAIKTAEDFPPVEDSAPVAP